MPGYPDVARILPECRAECVHRRGLVGAGLHAQHRGARSSVLVNQPQLVDAAEYATRAGDHDVVAVGRPLRRRVQVVRSLREGFGVRSIRITQPDIFRTVAIAQKDDALAVGRPARLRVEGGSRGYPRRGAPGHGHGVEIAQQLEDNRLAVGGHVERHPGRFRRLEAHRPRHLQRQRIELDRYGVTLGGVGRRWRWLLNGQNGSDNEGKHGLSGWKNDGVRERL